MIDDETYEPTPDELLLELLDLVTLAFPEPLTTASITFVSSPDGTRPCLTDLSGRAPAGTPKRPELGHVDNEVLDGINGLLGELANATERKAAMRVTNGRIEVAAAGPDGETQVILVEVDGDESIVRLRRRFDRSELSWLFFTPALFAALNETEPREEEQKRALQDALLPFQSFQIDMSQGRITFTRGARRMGAAMIFNSAMTTSSAREPGVDLAALADARVYEFELLGSWTEQTRRLLWGFANESVHPRLVRSVERLRQSSTAHGLRAFTEADLGCPEKMAERLARHAAVVTGAIGVYRAPFKSTLAAGFMYLALRAR